MIAPNQTTLATDQARRQVVLLAAKAAERYVEWASKQKVVSPQPAATSINSQPRGEAGNPPSDLRLELYGVIRDPRQEKLGSTTIAVYVVDQAVQNGLRPIDEIWITRDLDPQEVPLVVIREYAQLFLMRDLGLSDKEAHAVAAQVEQAFQTGMAPAELIMLMDGHLR